MGFANFGRGRVVVICNKNIHTYIYLNRYICMDVFMYKYESAWVCNLRHSLRQYVDRGCSYAHTLLYGRICMHVCSNYHTMYVCKYVPFDERLKKARQRKEGKYLNLIGGITSNGKAKLKWEHADV